MVLEGSIGIMISSSWIGGGRLYLQVGIPNSSGANTTAEQYPSAEEKVNIVPSLDLKREGVSLHPKSPVCVLPGQISDRGIMHPRDCTYRLVLLGIIDIDRVLRGYSIEEAVWQVE